MVLLVSAVWRLQLLVSVAIPGEALPEDCVTALHGSLAVDETRRSSSSLLGISATLSLVSDAREELRSAVTKSERASREFQKEVVMPLSRLISPLRLSQNQSNVEIDSALQKHGPHDECLKQESAAKIELNGLHEEVHHLTEKVNVTDMELQILHQEQQGTLLEIAQVDEWRQRELQKCNDEKVAFRNTLLTLEVTMQELKSSSAVGLLQVDQGKNHLEKHPAKNKTSSAKHHVQWGNRIPNKSGSTETGFFTANSVLLEAKRAVAANVNCALKVPDVAPNCTEEQEKLQNSSYKAFQKLSSLIDEYQNLVDTTACEDVVDVQYEERKEPYLRLGDATDLKIWEKLKELDDLQPLIEHGRQALSELQARIKLLGRTCQRLPATEEDLDRVDEALHTLGNCPRLHGSAL